MFCSEEFTLNHVGSVPLGFVALDKAGVILGLNQRAKNILQYKESIMIDGNRLAFPNPVVSATFQRFFQRAIAESASCAMPVARESGPPLTLLIDARSERGDSSSAAVIVFIGDSTLRPVPSTGKMRKFFGFTPSESRLAALLLRGSTLQQASQTMVITPHTARAHLKALFRKTAANRQSELIYVLLSSPSIFHTASRRMHHAAN